MEAFQSYTLPIDGLSAKFVEIWGFSPAKFLGVDNKNFEMYVICLYPTRSLYANYMAISEGNVFE